MLKLCPCLLLTLLVALYANDVSALTGGTCSGAGGTCTGEPNADTCDSAGTPACQCNIGWDGAGDDCVQMDCNAGDGTDAEADCGDAESVCNDAAKCVCKVNFEVDGLTCTQKTCTGTSTDNCDPNSACASSGGACECASTHTASGSRCKRDCSSGATVCDSNAACVGNVCECYVDYQGGGGTSDCTRRTCTTATVNADCASNSYCDATGSGSGNCQCKKNFHSTEVTECTAVACATDNACTESNSACTADSGGTCVCDHLSTADTTGACTRDTCTTATVTTDCGAQASCESISNTLQCVCNVNYRASHDSAATTCIQKTCTGTSTSGCDANSQCVNNKCQCANNFEPSGTTCVACPTGWAGDGTVCKKTCTADTDCGPTTAVCTSSSCECTTNYVGNGTSCTASTCTANSDCGTASNYTCTSGSCACASGFTFSTTARDCISSARTVLCSFVLMIAATFMSIFTGQIF